MDATALWAAYDLLLEVAAADDLGPAADGGWDADHILAHMISVDAGIASAALAVASGSRPTYDNRTALDATNLGRIIAEQRDRAGLLDCIRRQGAIVCAIAEQLTDEAGAVLVPALLLSNDVVVLDQPVPLSALLEGLAGNHIPEHVQQLRALRATEPAIATR